jgi:hypothetical protein
MGSPQKQAKRAKRAKAKAKQARTIRNNTSRGESVESIELSQQTFDLLKRMKEAEAVSRVEMLTTLLSDPGMATGSVEEAVEMQIILLQAYGKQVGEERPSDWMEDASFLKDYAEAARIVGKEELIEAWNDANDFES